ncbi:MAG: hypothetical protein QXU02_01925, partial [Candidatus Bathyarchaeia archaeon]
MVATANRWVIFPLLILALALSIHPAYAQVRYRVDREWVQIWINKDGSIDILYNITITYVSGTPKGIITLGMPKKGFQIHYVRDINGGNI